MPSYGTSCTGNGAAINSSQRALRRALRRFAMSSAAFLANSAAISGELCRILRLALRRLAVSFPAFFGELTAILPRALRHFAASLQRFAGDGGR